MLISVGLIGVAGLISLTYLEMSLRRTLVANTRAELERHAESFSAALPLLEAHGEPAGGDGLAKAMGRRHSIRLTFIDHKGRVLADSDVPAEQLSSLEDHGGRPEVRQALAGKTGVSERTSTTIQTDMLYVAIPHGHAPGSFVVRAAMPLAHVNTLIAGLRLALGIGGLLGLAVAVFMSGLASHFTTRTLREVVSGARRMAEGGARTPIHLRSRDEMQHIAGSVNRLAGELSEAVAELADERDRVSAILASMREGVLALDGARRVTLANPAALDLLGLKRAPVGRPLADVVRAPALLDVVAQAPHEGDEVEVDVPGPPERRLRARVTRRSEGEGTVLVLHDVTEMRRLERIRSDFVANVSHELRTPVTVIRANAEALLDGALHDAKRGPEFVAALHRSAERLSALVTDLLDLARIESDRFSPRLGDVGLQEVSARVAELLGPRAAAGGQRLTVGVPEGLLVRADEHALEQVLVNLIDNALKYTPEGGAIEVRARAVDDNVVLEVADDGPGIPAAHKERVFERFHRVDAGRSRDQGGTGLGLSIVKHLVLAMEGRVGVRDNLPAGSVFFVELPAARGAT